MRAAVNTAMKPSKQTAIKAAVQSAVQSAVQTALQGALNRLQRSAAGSAANTTSDATAAVASTLAAQALPAPALSASAPAPALPTQTDADNAGSLKSPEAHAQPGTHQGPAKLLSGWLRGQHMQASKLLAASLQPASLWPYVALLSPLLLTSVVAPVWVSWAMGVLSLLALYKAAPALEAALWQVPARRAFWVYTAPLQMLGLVWVLLATAAGNSAQVPVAVFPYLAVLCLLVAPTWRWQRARTQRRLPLRLSLLVLSLLATVVHGSAAFQALMGAV